MSRVQETAWGNNKIHRDLIPLFLSTERCEFNLVNSINYCCHSREQRDERSLLAETRSLFKLPENTVNISIT